MRYLLLACALLMAFAVSGCGSVKKYNRWHAACSATGSPNDCGMQGEYAWRLGKGQEAHRLLSYGCQGGSAHACSRYRKHFPNVPMAKIRKKRVRRRARGPATVAPPTVAPPPGTLRR